MEQQEDQTRCQIACLPSFFEGYAPIPPESLTRKLRLLIRRHMNSWQVRLFKTKTSKFIDRVVSVFRAHKESLPAERPVDKPRINAGDLVRIRSEAEIRATLNRWGQLKGCKFMSEEMSPYCNTLQRVFKPMERFVDERDYYVKKASGIILLEGLHCQGTSDYGRCDRSCFYFWREEWLEKIDASGMTLPASENERRHT